LYHLIVHPIIPKGHPIVTGKKNRDVMFILPRLYVKTFNACEGWMLSDPSVASTSTVTTEVDDVGRVPASTLRAILTMVK
jgi:hypothetical protein